MMNKNQKQASIGLITSVASLGGVLFGFDMAVISGVLPLVKTQFALTAAQEGWFVSSALIGCIAGVAFSGEWSDRYGRKKVLFIAALLFLLSAIGCTFSASFGLLVTARIIGGIGVGIASNVVPLYISEIAPANIRGRLVTYYQLAVTLGILIAYLTNATILNYSLKHNYTGQTFDMLFIKEVWRGMFSLGTIPALLFVAGLFFVPESPRWLIQAGRLEEAMRVFNTISNTNADNEASLVQYTVTQKQGSYSELWSPVFRKALTLGILLPLFSQFSGINAIIYYGPTILSNAGVSLNNSLLSQVIFGIANMIFTLIAVWKVDSVGRRPLYLIGTAVATFSLFATGLFFYLDMVSGIALLLPVLLFLACFAFSIGPLKFVVASEIFPGKIRGRAMAISIMVMWIADTIVGQLTPVCLKLFGAGYTFWLFALFCLVACFTVYRLLPETKGKSLEQIEGFWKNQHES